jgi:hypothetical protein
LAQSGRSVNQIVMSRPVLDIHVLGLRSEKGVFAGDVQPVVAMKLRPAGRLMRSCALTAAAR